MMGIGPYVPGDSLGVQVDMDRTMHLENKHWRTYYGKEATMVDLPVKDGTILFRFYAFDLPTDESTDFSVDDALIVFINGIKLDFNLLLSQPNVKRTEQSYSGDSLAGIKWKITRIPHRANQYNFRITAPLIVLLHKNQLDIDFVIKPKKATQEEHYAFTHLSTIFKAARCEVTDLENSPFEDFKSVVESKLFHKLGMDLAHNFQGKKGHCLYDKIPVVNVHLVEKEGWKDSKPNCGH